MIIPSVLAFINVLRHSALWPPDPMSTLSLTMRGGLMVVSGPEDVAVALHTDTWHRNGSYCYNWRGVCDGSSPSGGEMWPYLLKYLLHQQQMVRPNFPSVEMIVYDMLTHNSERRTRNTTSILWQVSKFIWPQMNSNTFTQINIQNSWQDLVQYHYTYISDAV